MATRLSANQVSKPPGDAGALRHDWSNEDALALFELPFNDMLYRAHSLFRAHFDPNRVQLSTLLNVKTGGCPEDCRYCAQSARYDTELKAEKIMALGDVLAAAKRARDAGAGRFCMGAAWREPKDHDLDQIIDMIQGVKALGLETCVTLGMLTAAQARRLKDGGLDYYNHNVDTSEDYYPEIITTRTYADRLETLGHVRDAGLKVCSGGILGMGEARADRASMLVTLANLPVHPESVPLNMLVKIPGTPLGDADPVEPLEFVRTIAAARIMMPASFVRLAAGRLEMSEELQALCLFAGANSIFYGDRLLTTDNPDDDADRALLQNLGIEPMAPTP